MLAAAAGAQTSPQPVSEPLTGARDQPAPTSIWARPNLLGDPGGWRSRLNSAGIALSATEQSEVFGNVTGGVRRGAAYDGLTTLSLGIDTKALGWAGGSFNVSALQIHGRNLSADNLYTLQTASGIAASRATRLWELWYQQEIPSLKADLKVGQQSLDQEFITSAGSTYFINTAMGWPLLPSVNMYAGGPAYPLASLGARIRFKPSPTVAVLAGVFDDNAAGGRFFDDGQLRGAAQSGTAFSLRTGALFIAEVQLAVNPPPGGVSETGAASPALSAPEPRSSNLPGTYKLGFWYDTGTFYDQRYDTARLTLADPASTGDPRKRRHNFGVYGVADQAVWSQGARDGQTLAIFARVAGGPGDRNVVDFSANGGLTLTAPFPGRGSDVAGIGFGVGRVSGSASALDRDALAFGGTGLVRSTETFVEFTYQAKISPWLTLQPDAQYVWHPGGGIANPLNPGKRIGNELVLGSRAIVTF